MVSMTRKQRDIVFRAIADPTRRRILGLLRHGRQPVGEIAANFRISRPAVSKHLRVLRSAGLIATRQEGASTLCSLNANPLQTVDAWLAEYAAFWSGSLASLKKHLEEES